MTTTQRILLTGASGYIGSKLLTNLISLGYRVNLLDLCIKDNLMLNEIIKNQDVNCFEGDIRDIEVIKKAVYGVDTLIHLAGISDGRKGKLNPELTKDINYSSLENVLEISKRSGVERVLFASTFGVYGNKYKEVLTEDLVPNPVDPYSQSKLDCERLIASYSDVKFATFSIRSAMVFGMSPNMRYDFLVNQLVREAFKAGQLTIFGGSQKRPQIHIDDLCDLLSSLLTIDKFLLPAEIFNAVSCNPSLMEIVNEILKQLPKTNIELLPQRDDEDSFEMDSSKLLNKTGFKSTRTLENGIKDIIIKLNSE